MPVTLTEAWDKFTRLCGPPPTNQEEASERARLIDDACGFRSEELTTFISAENPDGSPASDAVQEAIFLAAQTVYMGTAEGRGVQEFPMDEEVWNELWNQVPWLCLFTQDVLVMALKYGIFVGAIHARENAAELHDMLHGDPDEPHS